MGAIQMFGQSSTRSSPEIEPFISAIISGAELKVGIIENSLSLPLIDTLFILQGQKRIFVTCMLAEENFRKKTGGLIYQLNAQHF